MVFLVLLPIYEFVITIDQEVATVWLRGNKFSMASILLVSTRWCMFILAMLNLFPVTPEVSPYRFPHDDHH